MVVNSKRACQWLGQQMAAQVDKHGMSSDLWADFQPDQNCRPYTKKVAPSPRPCLTNYAYDRCVDRDEPDDAVERIVPMLVANTSRWGMVQRLSKELDDVT